jgi:hypothetical protein
VEKRLLSDCDALLLQARVQLGHELEMDPFSENFHERSFGYPTQIGASLSAIHEKSLRSEYLAPPFPLLRASDRTKFHFRGDAAQFSEERF